MADGPTQADQDLLKDLTKEDRELVLSTVKNHPGLSIEEALRMLKAAGL
jgi:hypothetical protein